MLLFVILSPIAKFLAKKNDATYAIAIFSLKSCIINVLNFMETTDAFENNIAFLYVVINDPISLVAPNPIAILFNSK